MNLLYLTDRLSHRGGAGLHLRQVIGWSTNHGHRVTVAFGCIDRDVELPRGVRGARVRGLAAGVESRRRLSGLGDLLEVADLVHVQNVMNPVALREAVTHRRVVATVQDHRVFCPGIGKSMPDGSRCVHTMSDEACGWCLPDAGYRRRTIELTTSRREALRGARLVVLSRYMRSELEGAGLPGAAVIPPWVSVDRAASGAGAGFLLAGRLVSHKGVADGWQAWGISGCDAPLRVAGEGPLADRLDDATVVGWLSQEGLQVELRRARAVLFPGRWQEPLGLVGIQALAEGTPVIVADTGGTVEWSGAGCLRVPAGDVDAMARAIETLDGDPGLARSLGAEGRAMVAERFSRNRIEAKLEEFYGKVVSGSSVAHTDSLG